MGAADGVVDLVALMGDIDNVPLFPPKLPQLNGRLDWGLRQCTTAPAPAPAKADSDRAATFCLRLEALQWQGLKVKILTQLHACKLYKGVTLCRD